MKKIISIILVLITIQICGQDKKLSYYYTLLPEDSLGCREYDPVHRLALVNKNNPHDFFFLSFGIYKKKKSNYIYGVYLEWADQKKSDTILSVKTEYGQQILVESRASKEMAHNQDRVFVPYSNGLIDMLSASSFSSMNINGITYYPIQKDKDWFISVIGCLKNVKEDWFIK